MKTSSNLSKIIKHPLTKIAIVVSILGTGASLLISTYSFFFPPPEKEKEAEAQKLEAFDLLKSTLIDTLYTLHTSASDFVTMCESERDSKNTNRAQIIDKANEVNNLVNKVLALKSDSQELPPNINLAVRAYVSTVDNIAEYTTANETCPSPLISNENLQNQINTVVREIKSSQVNP